MWSFKAEIVEDAALGPKLEIEAKWERPYPLEGRCLRLDHILDMRTHEHVQRMEVARELRNFAAALEKA
jgi:hypothetical protein